MIVKVFQRNKNGKIEFTKEELETLLNEVYWDGYNAHTTWTYTTPTPITKPKYQVTTDDSTWATDVSLGTEINKNEI